LNPANNIIHPSGSVAERGIYSFERKCADRVLTACLCRQNFILLNDESIVGRSLQRFAREQRLRFYCPMLRKNHVIVFA
jgi:hypothetical protein